MGAEKPEHVHSARQRQARSRYQRNWTPGWDRNPGRSNQPEQSVRGKNLALNQARLTELLTAEFFAALCDRAGSAEIHGRAPTAECARCFGPCLEWQPQQAAGERKARDNGLYLR